MWIFDAVTGQGAALWGKERGKVKRETIPLRPSFYLHLPDPHPHSEMLEALSSRYRVEECTFRTIFGPLDGYAIHAGRNVAEAIERQTRFAAQLYNVDIRLEQRWMAEQDLSACIAPGESRFAPEFEHPLTLMQAEIQGDPAREKEITRIDLGEEGILAGSEWEVVREFLERVEGCDPDVLLFPGADRWMPRIREKATQYDLSFPLSRTGRLREIGSRSYWSYGRMEYKGSALLPEGRILIDTQNSFNYREGGLEGVLMAARLTGITPNLASRLTAGTLISSYEVYEALKRGIAVPFRKSDPEELRACPHLRSRDRGGMMFQPVAGVYERVHELDFTSLYPSLIVLYNLSPETLHAPDRRGFLPEVLEPLLLLRKVTKQGKKTNPSWAGRDSILKWMLVTCFGYTGYRNAKFGRIEVHERITEEARDILLRSKSCAEAMGFSILHGIVDCLWVTGTGVGELKARIERETRLSTECETYDWITFLPMNDGTGAYNCYYGRRTDGFLKMRGVMARKGDTPPYVRKMQEEMLAALREATTLAELPAQEGKIRAIHARYDEHLLDADPGSFVVRRRISRGRYERRCAEASAVEAYRSAGIEIIPGMEIGYVVRDARTWSVDLPWNAHSTDPRYYRTLLSKAAGEVTFVFDWLRQKGMEKTGEVEELTS
jgi:DNA polymerase I